MRAHTHTNTHLHTHTQTPQHTLTYTDTHTETDTRGHTLTHTVKHLTYAHSQCTSHRVAKLLANLFPIFASCLFIFSLGNFL